MEDDNSSIPKSCSNGCKFFGNPIFNNMCSQCYKKSQQNGSAGGDKMTPSTPEVPSPAQLPSNPTTEPAAPAGTALDKPPIVEAALVSQEALLSAQSSSSVTTIESSVSASDAATPAADSTPAKPVQANKGRCFSCRAKIPLAKQQINKCRCEYVFCDSHRYPDKHDCDFDYAGTGRLQLAKSNPKVNERPKGGRSFNRINSN